MIFYRYRVLRHGGGGTSAYASHTRPPLTYLRGQRSPRVRHEMMGGSCMSRDAIEGPIHDGGHPTSMAMVFRRVKVGWGWLERGREGRDMSMRN